MGRTSVVGIVVVCSLVIAVPVFTPWWVVVPSIGHGVLFVTAVVVLLVVWPTTPILGPVHSASTDTFNEFAILIQHTI